jgi:hypothetical protein
MLNVIYECPSWKEIITRSMFFSTHLKAKAVAGRSNYSVQTLDFTSQLEEKLGSNVEYTAVEVIEKRIRIGDEENMLSAIAQHILAKGVKEAMNVYLKDVSYKK